MAIAVLALAPHCQHVGLVNCTTTTTASELDVEEAAAGSVVRFEMVVAGIDFAGLTSNVTLQDEFVGTIKEVIRSSLEEFSVLTSHIEVTLQAGSVKVTSTITPPSGENANALASGVNNLVQDLSIVEVLISGLSGINAVTTGAISITATEAIVVPPDTGGSASTTCKIWGCDGPLYLVVGGLFLGCLCCVQASYFLYAKSLVLVPALEGAEAEGEAAAAEVISAEEVKSQFEIHQCKNTLTQSNAHIIPDASDIFRCQQLCLEREYGAFVLWRGAAHFKEERAEVCEQGLFDDKEAITYVVAEFSF